MWPFNIFFKKTNIFPCKECIVKTVCDEKCDQLEHDSDKILNIMKEGNCCPDCGCTSIIEGPSGGMSQNIFCAECKHGFNMKGGIGVDRIPNLV